MKVFRHFALLVFLSASCWGQAQTPITAPPLITSQLSLPIYNLNADPMPGASLAVIGVPGQQTYCYWAVTNYAVGSVMSSLGCISNAPNTLSVSNYDAIYPIYPNNGNSPTFDFLRTTSASAPFGVCNCAVATGVALGASPTFDQSNSLNSYTVGLDNPLGYIFTFTNEVVAAGSTHLMLRQAGTLIRDLSLGVLSSPATFSTLAACAAGIEGSTAAVTDSTTATFAATITGGGANHVHAYCNGTNWIVE